MVEEEISSITSNHNKINSMGIKQKFTPAAFPLITSTPYFSIWSFSKHPANTCTKHWTGTNQSLCSFIKIDGQTYRILGNAHFELPVMELKDQEVTPTRTIYCFEGSGVRVRFTFTTAFIPSDLKLMSLPVTYISWELHSIDGKEHNISIYFDASSEITVNSPYQKVTWGRYKIEDNDVLCIGSKDQSILQKSGDDLRIDWGYLYLVADNNSNAESVLFDQTKTRKCFIEKGHIPKCDDFGVPRPANQNSIAASVLFNLGEVGSKTVEKKVLLAYDEIFSVEYFHRKLKPYWTHFYSSTPQMLKEASRLYYEIIYKCKEFDREILADLIHAGGEDYANLASISYRQAIAAHALVSDADGSPLLFSKENFSNGCIGTVDVIYPTAPIFLLFNLDLYKATLKPVLEYSLMRRWKFPYAPHDLGCYPLANGQVYGGGEETDDDQMPVEECGNMLLLVYAACYLENNVSFALNYWSSLQKWAKYLKEKGLNPDNQLCTDDFAGHLACNTNLSIKAILALAAYSKLCELAGKSDEALEYYELAKLYAKDWELMAFDDDHFRLAFDKPGTWSQKYNLIWDKIFEMNIFSERVFDIELEYYKKKINKYGLPLDSRKDYTKIDWLVWTAALCKDKKDFEMYISRAVDFVRETPDHVPLTDWYDTITGKQIGFQARSVVGGIFIKMMMDKNLWSKWINLD